MKIQTQEKLFNTLSIIVFAALAVFSGILYEQLGHRIEDIKLGDMVIMVLSAYRLTRLVVYDRIFRLPREIVEAFPDIGFMVSIRSLLTCPWCAGVWASLVAFVFQYLIPYAIYLNYLLAIAGVASFILIMIGRIGKMGGTEEKPEERVYGCE